MNSVKVDITIDETSCFPLHEHPILRQYELFDDLPEGPTVNVYSLEEIKPELETKLAFRQCTAGTVIQIVTAKKDRLVWSDPILRQSMLTNIQGFPREHRHRAYSHSHLVVRIKQVRVYFAAIKYTIKKRLFVR